MCDYCKEECTEWIEKNQSEFFNLQIEHGIYLDAEKKELQSYICLDNVGTDPVTITKINYCPMCGRKL